MANRLKQWMECACVCQHSRRPPVRPPRLTCVFTQKGFSTYIVEHHHWLRGVGALAKMLELLHTSNNLSATPGAFERERERARAVYLCAFLCFPQFSFLFHPHHEKSTKQKLLIRISLSTISAPIRRAFRSPKPLTLTNKDTFSFPSRTWPYFRTDFDAKLKVKRRNGKCEKIPTMPEIFKTQ